MQKFQLERKFYVQPMCKAFHVEVECSLMDGSSPCDCLILVDFLSLYP